MKISVLTENCSSDIGFLAEWGLSFWIEAEDKKILFDSWFSNVFIKNAEKLNIELNSLDFIVVSHHHNDHINGLFELKLEEKKNIIFHNNVLNKLKAKEVNFIKNNFIVNETKNPFFISENIVFLWEIPRTTNFESRMIIEENDNMLDDSAVAINTPKWIIVISWCSHSWICNICEYSKSVFDKNLHAVIGWFHLFDNTEVVDKTIDYFKNENIEHLYPLHCINLDSLVKFKNIFNIRKLSAGEVLEIN